jgi:sRNA-binding protein
MDGAMTPIEVARALRVYTSNIDYLRNMLAGTYRIDLDGKATGTVTPEDEACAWAKRAAWSARIAARAENEARAKAKAKAIEAAKPKQITLADLKAAAQERNSRYVA